MSLVTSWCGKMWKKLARAQQATTFEMQGHTQDSSIFTTTDLREDAQTMMCLITWNCAIPDPTLAVDRSSNIAPAHDSPALQPTKISILRLGHCYSC